MKCIFFILNILKVLTVKVLPNKNISTQKVEVQDSVKRVIKKGSIHSLSSKVVFSFRYVFYNIVLTA